MSFIRPNADDRLNLFLGGEMAWTKYYLKYGRCAPKKATLALELNGTQRNYGVVVAEKIPRDQKHDVAKNFDDVAKTRDEQAPVPCSW